jgi:uncharacterized membrane protein YbhN (UPF0104 family)
MEASLKRRLLLAGGLALGAVAAWVAFRDLRLADLASVLAAIGPAAALVFIPQTVSMALDAVAWGRVLRRLGDEVGFVHLARARVAAEFMAITLPGGPIVADGTLSVMLTRWSGVRPPDAVAAVAARKLMIWRAHAACLMLAGLGTLAGLGSAVTRQPLLWGSLLAGAVAVTLVSVLLGWLVGAGRPAERLHALLLRVPSRRLRAAMERGASRFQDTDARLAVAARTRVVRAQLLYVVAWVARAAEPWVILHLAGAPLSFVDVLAAEAVVGVVRSLAFVVPAGLGVQELGYAMFLRLGGAPDPAALTAALAILRRTREAFWATAGYALLWGGSGRAVAPSAVEAEAEPEAGRATNR